MRNILLIFLISLLSKSSCCQDKSIAPPIIHNLKTLKFLVVKDSIVKEYDQSIVEVEKIAVKFFEVFYNKKTKEVRLVGRSCWQDTTNCMPWPAVGIFRGVRSNGVLSKFELIAESKDAEGFESDGFFDIRFNLEKGISLFFYLPNFYLEEYRISELLTGKY